MVPIKIKKILCLAMLAVAVVVVTGATATTVITAQQQQQLAFAWVDPDPNPRSQKAPIAISGDSVYVVWFTDKGTPNSNGEVIFRASSDGGATFDDKVNLSNTNDTDSINAEIATEGDNDVIVMWWERANATSNEPVARISTNNGQSFGPLLQLGANGTIDQSE